MNCPKWIGSPRPPSLFRTLRRLLKKRSSKNFTTVICWEESLLRCRREERRRKEEVCWNLLLIPIVACPDCHRGTFHDHGAREKVTLLCWLTCIYKSLVRANRRLSQLCKGQDQEGEDLGENELRRLLLEVQRGWLPRSHDPLHVGEVTLHRKRKELFPHQWALRCLLQVV